MKAVYKDTRGKTPRYVVTWREGERWRSRRFKDEEEARQLAATIPLKLRRPRREPLPELHAEVIRRGFVEIPLSQGMVALVDVDDYPDIGRWNWSVLRGRTSGPYAARRIKNQSGRWVHELMHRRLLPGVKEIDHINGDGLDNRRSNLRPATRAENVRNRSGLNARSSTGYRGVWSRRNRWRSCIKIDGRTIHLGTFDTGEEAARAYDAAAIDHFGEFHGYLNFPGESGSWEER